MAEIHVGSASDFGPHTCRLLRVEGQEVGVRWRDGRFFAYENRCAHQGGPVCEGVVVGRVEQPLGPNAETLMPRMSEERLHLVCPWHGWEYDLATGEFAGDSSIRLTRYEVVQRGDDLYVVV